jgi:PleD family two-component response regulator
MTPTVGPPEVAGGPKRQAILVVMQDPGELSAMELALERAGYDPVRAMNVQHALRDLPTVSPTPDGVMLDAGIPRPTLTSLVEALASTPRFASVPIVFIRQHRLN